MSVYSIKDLEHLTGIKAHTIRMWEQRYGMLNPKRTDTNIRYYDSEDLKHMLNVALLNGNGYKVSRIAQMSKEEVCQEVLKILDKANNYSDQIAALTVAMVELNEAQFDKIISTSILQMGFEQTMIHVAYPFMVRVGFLWQTGAISPAQEHFISNLLRQKLVLAIDGLLPYRQQGGLKYMLFLPEGELHELGLLFGSYLIKQRGNQVIYLGQTLPLSDLRHACKIHDPDVLFTTITTSPDLDEVEEYMEMLGREFSSKTILVSGYQVVGQDLQLPDNVLVIPSFRALIEFVEEHNEQSVRKGIKV